MEVVEIDGEKIDYGRNVGILLKFIRHGDRTKDNYMTDFGREKTRKNAEESCIKKNDFGAVKAIGSTVGPYNERGMGRALETSHIYAQEVAGDEAFNTRPTEVLSYDKLASPFPYDHKKIFVANLPTNFDTLFPEQKS